MKRIGNFVNFTASCVTAVFVITVATMVATGVVGHDGGSFFSYDDENEILTFLGEAIPMEREIIGEICGYPRRAAEFVAGFLPDAVREGLNYVARSIFGDEATTLKDDGEMRYIT